MRKKFQLSVELRRETEVKTLLVPMYFRKTFHQSPRNSVTLYQTRSPHHPYVICHHLIA